MKKLSVTYRATIDRHVPITVRSRSAKKIAAPARFARFVGRSRVTA
jgi:hypothetical protein